MAKKIDKKENQDKRLEELEAGWRRALADYHNLEKRVNREKEEMVKFASRVVIAKFLPILDNLEKAQKHLNDEGINMIINQFKDSLKSEGVEEIEALNIEFNPHFMEAVKTVPGEKDNIVVEVLQNGYKMGEKALRPAQVVVAKKES